MPVLGTMNEFASVLLAGAMNSLLIVAAIAWGVWALLRFVVTLNASTRHAIWWTVLAAVLAVPFVRGWMALSPAETTTSPMQIVAVVGSDQAQPEPVAALPGAEQLSPKVEQSFEVNPGYAPLAILAIAVLVMLRQAIRLTRSFRRLRALKASGVAPTRDLKVSFDEWVMSSGVKRPARLLLSDDITSPIAVGFSNPAVLIPRSAVERLSQKDLDHILLHELAHLARRDDWTNLLARIACGVLALHPVAAWVLRRIDEDREIACDDWVVSMTGAAKPYAVSLSRYVEFRIAQSREALATGIGGRHSHLVNRIERLLRTTTVFDCSTSAPRVALTCTALIFLVAASTLAPAWIAFAQDEFAPPPPPPPVAVEAPLVPEAPEAPAAPVPATPSDHPALAEHSEIRRIFIPPAAPTPQLSVEIAMAAPPVAIQAPPAPPAPPARAVAAPPPPPPPSPAAPQKYSGGSFLKALADAGYSDLPVEEIIELRQHGVSASYLRDMNAVGWGRLTTRQIIELRNHGVQPDYVRAFKEAGYGSASLREVIEARNHGVRAEHLREAKNFGNSLSVRQIIRLKQAGVL
jgi:beta-lactamase regulating signal transducer with metallopeptidase domain